MREKGEIVLIFLAAIPPMRQCQRLRLIAEALCRAMSAVEPIGLRTGCNAGRCTFTYRAVFSGPADRLYLRGFWTSKGIFAQRWGLNAVFDGWSFKRSKAFAARRAADRPSQMR